MTTRVRHTATPLYPGSLYPEEGRATELSGRESPADVAAALDDDDCFAIEVSAIPEKLWTDGAGNERWLSFGQSSSYRIYFGTLLSYADVEALPGDYSTLLANMKNNGWDPIIRTRRGNFQPFEKGDVVL